MDLLIKSMLTLCWEANPINPTIYVKGDDIISNIYTANAHPNDKKSKAKMNESKGRMIGLEEAGYIGYSPLTYHTFNIFN